MSRSLFFLLMALLTIVHVLGMIMIDLMEHDATQYATISMQMVQDDSWLIIHWRNVEYLDKPPLVFWTAGLLFKLFGFSHFLYRLPSFLVLMAGLFATYQLSRRLYNTQIARLAVLIFYSSQAVFLMVHDVRTDTMLTGFIIISLWQLYVYLEDKKFQALLAAFAAIAFGMLTKGPIALMVPVLAFGPQLLIQKRWKDIFRWEWLFGLIIVFIIISPMLWGLYQQFDMRPEIWANGRQNVSGLRFYFWEQSFGRITGENVWKDTTGPFFFLHTFLWAFLPWSILAVAGFFIRVKAVRQSGFKSFSFDLWAILLVFIGMSNAQFKLPHYINIVFPLMAIHTALAIQKLRSPFSKYFLGGQLFVVSISWLAIISILTLVFPLKNWFFAIILLALFTTMLYSWKKSRDTAHRIFYPSILTILALNLVLNTYFYPKLLAFQSGSSIPKEYLKNDGDPDKLAFFCFHRPSFDFYARRIVPEYHDDLAMLEALHHSDTLYLFTDTEGLERLRSIEGLKLEPRTHKDFKATQLQLPFLYYQTRPNHLKETHLVKTYKAKP